MYNATEGHRNVLKTGSQADYLGSKQESAGKIQDLKHKPKVVAEQKFGGRAKQWPKKVSVFSSHYYIEFYGIWSILIYAVSGRKFLQENLLITFKINSKNPKTKQKELWSGCWGRKSWKY